MADVVQFLSAPDDQLDCLYLAVAEKERPLERLALPARDRQAIAKVVEELGVRGTDGEVLVTASPIKGFRRIACFGVGKLPSFTVNALRKQFRRVV